MNSPTRPPFLMRAILWFVILALIAVVGASSLGVAEVVA